MNSKNKYPMIFLCTPSTVVNIKRFYAFFLEYISPSQIIVIGNEKVKEIIEKEQLSVKYIDEDKIYDELSFYNVKRAICARKNDEDVEKRTGWYFQQFLKMAFCNIVEENEYLIWDSDTIPTHNVDMYSKNDKMYFDVKTEYHEPYFNTLKVLIPELEKNTDYSFISEHMIVDKNIMLELIKKIESNSEIAGDCFWEKIINAIDINELSKSGFSEFETYGTYCKFYHSDSYEIRKWKSLREGMIFFGENIDKYDLSYLSKTYDAVSFENHEIHIRLKKVFCHKIFQRLGWINTFEICKDFLKKMIG